MGDSNTVTSEKINKEAIWMKETIKKLEGTFQYLVVFNHKSIYGAYAEDSGVHKKITPQWFPIFDECNVDLVLSGHDHMYSRTYRLYNNKVTEDTKIGTYYLDMGSSGDKRRVTEDEITNDGLHEKTYNLKELGESCGANIEVSPTQMVVTVYNNKKKVMDTFTIKSKREPLEINCDGFNKDEFFNNLKLTANSEHTGTLTIDDIKNIGYVENISVTCGDNTCLNQEIDYNHILDLYALENINSEKLYVKVSLKDGTSYREKLDLDLGVLNNLNTKFEDLHFYLSFYARLYKVVDYTANIYCDDLLIKTLTDDELKSGKIDLSLDYFHGNHKFSVKIESNKKVLKEVSIDYLNDDPLKVKNSKYKLKIGESKKLEYDYKYEDLVTFNSTDKNVVEVDNNGNITAIGKGSANIEINVLGMEPYLVNITVGSSSLSTGAMIAIISSSAAVVAIGVILFLLLRKR